MVAPSEIDRRALLALLGGGVLGGGVLGAVVGCSSGSGSEDPTEHPQCVPAGDLQRFAQLRGLPLVYEVSQQRTSFRIEDGFAGQLEAWLGRLGGYGIRADQVWTYGAWTDGGSACDSWHGAGRAFDLARLRQPGGIFVSCRYDRWQTSTGAVLDRARRSYWALAASLHRDFAYVLTYLYNSDHHNHIHIDNGRSGSGAATFSARSPAQVQAVQAICSYLWAEPLELTGRWDSATRRAVGRVLDGLGAPDDLTDTRAWSAFTSASAQRFPG